MQVTLLGTGDATGVPAALCECAFCRESDRRRRPGLLVTANEHARGEHTDALEETAAAVGCEVGADFDTYEI